MYSVIMIISISAMSYYNQHKIKYTNIKIVGCQIKSDGIDTISPQVMKWKTPTQI